MDLKDFYAIIDSKLALEESMIPPLRDLTKQYPFFQAGIYIYIKCLYSTNSELLSSELNRLSAFIHNRETLFHYVMADVYKQFYHQTKISKDKDRTNLLINAFFETQEETDLDNYFEQTLSHTSTVSSEYLSNVTLPSNVHSEEKVNFEDELELMDDNVNQESLSKSTIYRLPEINNEPEVALKHQDLIDSFLSKTDDFDKIRIKIDEPANLPSEKYLEEDDLDDKPEEELDDDFFFTQTLANIYIKQKKFKRAYEIIKRLSLNYPEKNSYFADQLSFLEKAVKNLKK